MNTGVLCRKISLSHTNCSYDPGEQENRNIKLKKVKTAGFKKGMIAFRHDCLVPDCHSARAPVCDSGEEGWHEPCHASWT